MSRIYWPRDRKAFLRRWLPEGLRELLNKLGGCANYYRGEYADWAAARVESAGYDAEHILEKVKSAQLKVQSGQAAYERDSVLFDQVQYSFPVLTALQYAALSQSGRLSVLDYGGALGSSYFQCRAFFKGLSELEWSVVEQPNFVECGQCHFTDNKLEFFKTIAACLAKRTPNVALLSSVLQYVPEPYAVLDEIKGSGLSVIVLDRTPISDREDDFLTIQHVPKKIYSASYPCWIFGRSRIQDYLAPYFEVMAEFDSADGQGRVSGTVFNFRGLILRKRDSEN